jgi:hypothetical protein
MTKNTVFLEIFGPNFLVIFFEWFLGPLPTFKPDHVKLCLSSFAGVFWRGMASVSKENVVAPPNMKL